MIPMRRCMSAAVIDAAPLVADCCRCPAAMTGSAASRSARRYRIAIALRNGDRKLTCPAATDYGRARAGTVKSGLTPLQLRLAPWLLLRGLLLRLYPRLAARRRRFAPWLGTRPVLRRRATPRLLWPRRLLPQFRLRGALGLLGPIAAIRQIRALAPRGAGRILGIWRRVRSMGMGRVAEVGRA